jgi:hypothetical protein
MMNFERSASYKRDFVPKNMRLRKSLGLPVPRYNRAVAGGKRTTWPSVIVKNAVLLLAKLRWFRRLCLFLAQTRPAITWLAWNRKRKARRHATAYGKLEKFVGQLMPSETSAGSASSNGSSGVSARSGT